MYDQYNICNRVAAEGIDEVWIYVDNQPGHDYGWEWQANGPLWKTGPHGNSESDTAAPDCGKQMFTMGFKFDAYNNPELESWAHSVEHAAALTEESGSQRCDFYHLGITACLTTVTHAKITALTTAMSAASNDGRSPATTVAVCGEVHYPPNTTMRMHIRMTMNTLTNTETDYCPKPLHELAVEHARERYGDLRQHLGELRNRIPDLVDAEPSPA